MYVYRVEHKDPRIRLGPYQCYVASKPHLYDDDHPSPTQSGITMEPDDYSCFVKKEDLTKWFKSSDITDFKTYGLDVFRFETKAENVKIGERQAAFKRDKAYKRERITLH